jgi:predicted nucleotidyltransferase component of viral defense system
MEQQNRELIQVLTLAEACRAMGSSLIFQGGTAIRIFFGGTRTSEDLDFYTQALATDRFEQISQKISSALAQILDYVDDLSLDSHKVSRQKRLHTLWFTFKHGTSDKIRLKAEFYQTGKLFQKIESQAGLLIASPLVRREISTFNMFLDRLNLVVRVEKPKGILADKAVAVLARPYIKGRDFWDIWFLREVLGTSLSKEDVEIRKYLYKVKKWERPPALGGEYWPSLEELVKILDSDLKRFLQHEELEGLRGERYERILRCVKNTLAELL